MKNPAIVMFAKAPVPGQVKTRLGVVIGNEASARLHGAFLADLAQTISDYDAIGFLAYAGDPNHPGFDAVRAAGLTFVGQGDGDLGTRLTNVIGDLFKRGHDAVITIGSDSPTLSSAHFDEALDALSKHDVYLGPSFDGGFYLIAMKAPTAAPFQGITWSTERVAQETVQACRSAGLDVTLGQWWYDVDEIEDLQRLHFHVLDVLCNHSPESLKNTASVLVEFDDALFRSD